MKRLLILNLILFSASLAHSQELEGSYWRIYNQNFPNENGDYFVINFLNDSIYELFDNKRTKYRYYSNKKQIEITNIDQICNYKFLNENNMAIKCYDKYLLGEKLEKNEISEVKHFQNIDLYIDLPLTKNDTSYIQYRKEILKPYSIFEIFISPYTKKNKMIFEDIEYTFFQKNFNPPLSICHISDICRGRHYSRGNEFFLSEYLTGGYDLIDENAILYIDKYTKTDELNIILTELSNFRFIKQYYIGLEIFENNEFKIIYKKIDFKNRIHNYQCKLFYNWVDEGFPILDPNDMRIEFIEISE